MLRHKYNLQALMGVGGFDEATVTEDFATSLKLHMAGWKSLYYNHVNTFGMAPESLDGYFRQQFRWANGTISVFRRVILELIRRPFSLRPIQWWDYLLSGSYYMIGLAFFSLMLCSVVYLLFEVPSFFARPEIYFLAFLPYFIFSMMVFYTLLASRNYKLKDLFLGQLLGEVTFSVYMRSAFMALFGLKTGFGITQKNKTKSLPYYKLWPQISMLMLNFVAVVWGINRFIYERNSALLVNGFWAGYHFIVLSSVFYFNEDISKEYCKILPKGIKLNYKILDDRINIEGLSKDTLKSCFVQFLPQRLKPGTLVMFKVYIPGNDVVVFDGRVIWSSEKLIREGYKTNIGIFTIQNHDKARLKGVLIND